MRKRRARPPRALRDALDRSGHGEDMRIAIAVLVAPLLVSSIAGANGDATCTLTDEQFFQQIAMIKSWSDIHAVYERNLPACPDDGSYAEGYSGVIEVTFAKHWSTLAALQALVARDSEFRTFVL